MQTINEKRDCFMTIFFIHRLCIALTCIGLLSACSRPIAYFQHTVATSATSQRTQRLSEVSIMAAVDGASIVTAHSPSASHISVSQFEAYVRNDVRLATNKKLHTRMERLKNALSESVKEKTRNVTSMHIARKMNVVERLMLKKLNTRVKNHLAPTHPERAMVNRGLLSGGAILFIIGLLLLLFTTGTASAIGLIALLIGILALILGLIAS